MLNSYLKLYPDGCQVRFFQFKNNTPVVHTDFVNLDGQAHSDYVSLSRTKRMIYDYARSNDFKYFVTLTFNPEKVDSFSCDDSYIHMQNWLKNYKRKYNNLKYLGVPELHKSGRFHFHFLMSDDIKSDLLDSGKRDKGHIIYNVGSYRLGWSTAIELYDKSKVPSYMVKYITKDLKERSPNKRRYWNSHNLVLPKTFATYMDLDKFAEILEKLDVTYSSTKQTDTSFCDFYEVALDSCDELFPFLERYRDNINAYDGIPDGFFPTRGCDLPF